MTDGLLGHLVDDLGVRAELRSDEVLTDVVVVGKIAKLTGDRATSTRLMVRTSDGCDWITSLGLLHAASLVATDNLGPEEEDD